MDLIDAHVHVWTEDIDRYPLAPGVKATDLRPRHFPAETLRTHTAPCGVARIVLIQVSFYGTDNSYMLDTIAKSPDEFRGVAVVDSSSPELAHTMDDLARQGVRGFRITPGHTPDQPFLAARGYDDMFALAADRGLAICPLIDPRHLPALAVKCRRFPETPVIIDHLCRIGAASARHGRIAEPDIVALCDMAQFPQVMVKVSAFYALGLTSSPYDDLAPLIRRVHSAFGPERLMWASDSPYQVVNGHQYADSVNLINRRLDFLTTQDRARMLGGTADQFFFAR